MRLIAFKHSNGDARLGARDGDFIVDLTAAGFPSTLDEFLRCGKEEWDKAAKVVSAPGSKLRADEIKYLPPIANPGKAIAVGLNYVDHAAETKLDLPTSPVLFNRFASSWVGHGEDLVRPKASIQFDYEAELVAVIGKAGRHIPKTAALEHVAGYSLFNDGSIRDYQFRTHQWMAGKNFDRTGSFGPEFVTADELPGGAAGLRIQCRLNGQVVQDANTRDMIFDVATLVAYCSEIMTLQPGDIIITGTPSGIGLARTPQLWMKAGDVCEVEVEGFTILKNAVVDEAR